MKPYKYSEPAACDPVYYVEMPKQQSMARIYQDDVMAIGKAVEIAVKTGKMHMREVTGFMYNCYRIYQFESHKDIK